MTSDTLANARKRKAEIIAINGSIQRLNPLEKARQNPKSRKLAINAKCFECEGEDYDPGWTTRIRTCIIPNCPLHPLRPYQVKDKS